MKNFQKGSSSGGDRSSKKFGGRDSGGRSFGGSGRGFGGGRDAGRPTVMHKATCSQCGKECQLPFRPTGSRAVFCSSCFEVQKNGDSERSERSFDRPEKKSFGRPNFEDKKMFEAVCSNCGNGCLVPFRPIGGKPVFCNKCFDKGDNVVNRNFVVKSGSVGNGNVEQFKAQFETLNIKLDRILRELTQGSSFEEGEDDGDMDSEEIELKKLSTKDEFAPEAKEEKAKTPKKAKKSKK